MKILYKKDGNNRIRFLTIKVNVHEKGELIQISGILNTDNPIVHTKICKGKNIGRSNETTQNDQAVKEATALIKDKLTKGYFNTIEEAETEEVILPMLAKDFKKESHKINWEKDKIYVQPKLDGMRCLAHLLSPTEVILKSRDGKVIENMMHIEIDLMRLSLSLNQNAYPHIFDGELYVHGEDFQTNMESIKKYRKGITEKIKFHIYDKINPEDFTGRKGSLAFIHGLAVGHKLRNLDFIQSHIITSEDQLKKAHLTYLELGYEGTMIRVGSGEYKVNGRSSDLLKYKDFIDIACKIIDIGPAKQRPEWGRPVVEYNGKCFACGTKMSHEARKELLLNKDEYIGKIAEVRYFEMSQGDIPRFPVMHGIRLDKDKSDK